jgi:hypothetical protein
MESLTNPARQFTRSQFRLRRHQIPKMLAHLGRQLVRIFGPWLVRQQSFEPTLLKVMLGLVNRRARKAKFSSRLGDGITLLFQSPQRFVFELQQVAGIKEIRLFKQGVANPVVPGVERA